MKTIVKLIALVVLTLIIVLTYINKAEAGGPWSDQYCDIDTTTIRVVDQDGNIIEEEAYNPDNYLLLTKKIFLIKYGKILLVTKN